MILPALLGEFGKAFVGDVADRICNELLPRVDAAARELKALREEVRERFDRQDVSELLAGVEFLQIGRVEDAIRSFVKAKNVETENPVAALLLATALARQGDLPQAGEKLREALLLNPFVAAELMPTLAQILPPAPEPAQPARWAQLGRASKPSSVRALFAAITLRDSQARSLALAYDPFSETGHALVLWERASRPRSLEARPPRKGGFRGRLDDLAMSWSADKLSEARVAMLSSFPLSGEAKLVSRSLPADAELTLVTPSVVVVHRNATDEFELYDTHTLGIRGIKMRRRYFELVFCPFLSSLDTFAPYARSHRSLTTSAATVRRALADQCAAPGSGLAIRDAPRAKHRIATERVQVRPPIGAEHWYAAAINEYWTGTKLPSESLPRLNCRAAFGRAQAMSTS